MPAQEEADEDDDIIIKESPAPTEKPLIKNLDLEFLKEEMFMRKHEADDDLNGK